MAIPRGGYLPCASFKAEEGSRLVVKRFPGVSLALLAPFLSISCRINRVPRKHVEVSRVRCDRMSSSMADEM